MDLGKKVDLDWENLGFGYRKTDCRFVSYWDSKTGWDSGKLEPGGNITIPEGSSILHYGQGGFEGLKAHTAKDARILLFRPQENAARMRCGAGRMMMPEVTDKMFMDGCQKVIRANWRWIPPYGTGASLYIRPLLIGIGDNLGLKPAEEYMFLIFVCPVGPFFKHGFRAIRLRTTGYDRAAPNGVGHIKVPGNYAASFWPRQMARNDGFDECLYLDPESHWFIEETSATNFFAVRGDGELLVTPESSSILPSITRCSIMHLAREIGIRAEERSMGIDDLDYFAEAAVCGTAAVITPVGEVVHRGKSFKFFIDGNVMGSVTRRLYTFLADIQTGDKEAPEGWIVEV